MRSSLSNNLKNEDDKFIFWHLHVDWRNIVYISLKQKLVNQFCYCVGNHRVGNKTKMNKNIQNADIKSL